MNPEAKALIFSAPTHEIVTNAIDIAWDISDKERKPGEVADVSVEQAREALRRAMFNHQVKLALWAKENGL